MQHSALEIILGNIFLKLQPFYTTPTHGPHLTEACVTAARQQNWHMSEDFE